MRLRSLLFVPGDRPERMEKALGFGADALILDLEDAVAADNRPRARDEVARFLATAERRATLFVRVNPLDGKDVDLDLNVIAAGKPDGIVLPKAEGAVSVEALANRMAARDLFVPILPIATETPAAIFQLGSYGPVAHRLAGLTWGAEDLPAAIGATTSREEDGRYTAPYEMARAFTLFGAHAAGVPAIETVFPAFHDGDGLARYAARAARDGFTGMMAIHPAQIETINAAFTPSAAAIAQARRVVEAFAANPDAGVLPLDGRMIDAPHLKQARHVLTQAGG
ncbi:HpcH/HpaI aldolase/citrate lyase family protein [Sphingomonas abietis]|uniref:CoA ester lyase n=1 Tax=Sphingomonas abietis TaxID=3012344 RepID=A0ABY7NK95_9SPHN|nr:CoA ester lyase [Sphingomonas abietis]WBO21923.1 CoA ester lyase [Sphingomonas abietis]